MSSDYPERERYPATCSRCKEPTTVPFQPDERRPVYCRECYKLIREEREDQKRKDSIPDENLF